jgi:hypothetical protein
MQKRRTKIDMSGMCVAVVNMIGFSSFFFLVFKIPDDGQSPSSNFERYILCSVDKVHPAVLSVICYVLWTKSIQQFRALYTMFCGQSPSSNFERYILCSVDKVRPAILSDVLWPKSIQQF